MAGRTYLVFLLTLAGGHVTYGEPVVTLDPAGVGHDKVNVQLSCSFGTTSPKTVQWEAKGKYGMLIYKSPDTYVTSPDYDGRLTYERNAQADSHSMFLIQTNQCDAGTYTCKVTDQVDAETTGSAILTAMQMDIDGEPFTEPVTKKECDKGMIKCSAWWDSEDVKVTLTHESSTKTSDKASEDDRKNCGFKAEAEMAYDMSSGEQSYTCTAEFAGSSETLSKQIKVEAGECDNNGGDNNNGGGDNNNGGGDNNNDDDNKNGGGNNNGEEAGNGSGCSSVAKWSMFTFLSMLLAITWQ